MTASERHASTENDIRIRRTFSAANYRLTFCGLLFELFMRGVTNFNGVSLVFLQLLKVSEQRFVELRIMLFDLFRDNDSLDLHFICDYTQHLHKRRYTLG